MKRSAIVSLVIMGSAAAALSGCKPKAESYQTKEACIATGEHTEKECEYAFETAKREHETSAPHYASREECAASYGWDGCEERHAEGGTGFFLPMMMGYMMGGGFAYHPLYQDRYSGNGYVGAGGTRFNGFTSTNSRSSGSGGFEEKPSTSSRGGFGSVGEGMSAGG